MGQWSTRSKRGGKSSPPTPLALMVVAKQVGSVFVRITWNQNVDLDNVDAQDFVIESSLNQGNGIDEITPNSARLAFDDEVNVDEIIKFTGAQGLQTDQTIAIVA